MSNKNIHLVAYYSIKPRKHVNTSKAGWMNDQSNIQYDEKVEIVRGLKPRTIGAKIVLDFNTKEVVRNGFNQDKDFKKLFKYFFAGYHQYMTTVMKQLDPEWMDAIVDELEAEMSELEAADAEATKEIEAALDEVSGN